VLDTQRSDRLEPQIEAALAKYDPPRARRPRLPRPENGAEAVAHELERSLEPLFEPPGVAELRADLRQSLHTPLELRITARPSGILIGSGEHPDRIVEPGRPHSRVDDRGTANIKTAWKSGSLVIAEKYERKRELVESYTLQRDGTLAVAREIERPGLKRIRVQAIYMRGTEPAPGGR
jgi:hypothetical protein